MDQELPSGPRRFAGPQDNAVERVWDGEMAGRTDPPHQPRRPAQVSAPGVIHRAQPDADAGHAPRPKVEFMRPPSRRAPASPRRTLGLLGTALLAASAAACGQADADPVATRTSSAPVQVPVASIASAAPATSSTTGFDVVARMPAAATAHTDQGAEAFARYFFEASSKVVEQPSQGQFSLLCVPDAPACKGREEKVKSFIKDGLRLSGPELTVHEALIIPGTPLSGKYAYVTVLIEQHAPRKLRKDGTDAGEDTAAKEYGAGLKLQWLDSSWKAVEVTHPGQEKIERQP